VARINSQQRRSQWAVSAASFTALLSLSETEIGRMVERVEYSASVSKRQREVLGVTFSPLTRNALVERILRDRMPVGAGVRLVATANLDHIVNLVRNARFRAAYASTWAATADGAPVFAYARLRGCEIAERVTGADLTASLLEGMEADACRPFFATSSERAGVLLRQALIARGFSAESVAYHCPQFGFERDPAASARLATTIRDHRTTHLFVGLGAPKSEIWVHENRALLGDTYALAIGASLDFYLGLRKRAPTWMRRVGCEWLWRLMSEPKRLSRRYLLDSWLVFPAVANDLLAGSPPETDTAATQKQQAPA
jgi:N-acetylglucosaminyldiphosphoundecaprenol N-acetyl-beta-D-mannosaminyltransferase